MHAYLRLPQVCDTVHLGALSKPQCPHVCGQNDLLSSWIDLHPNGLVTSSSAAAAFLVSLYIKDIWLGAQRPDTLLTHVRMVCDSAEDVPSGNKEAIFMLCRDLTTSAPDAWRPACCLQCQVLDVWVKRFCGGHAKEWALDIAGFLTRKVDYLTDR